MPLEHGSQSLLVVDGLRKRLDCTTLQPYHHGFLGQSRLSSAVPRRRDQPAVPKPHPKTGLVHCMLERTTKHNGGLSLKIIKKTITLRLEDDDKNAVLQAKAVSAHQFAIFSGTNNTDDDVDDKNHQPLATLVRLQSNLTSITYGLRNAQGITTAVILYKVPTVSSYLKGGPPPRRAQVALRLAATTNDTKEGKEEEVSSSSEDDDWFEVACRDSIQQQGNLNGFLQQQDGSSTTSSKNNDQVALLTSQEPYLKKNGNVGLNFAGRGRQASPKNMQLVTAAAAVPPPNNDKNNKAAVVGQMAKWETDQYHLDFAAPLDLVTAFAFGLAQLDL